MEKLALGISMICLLYIFLFYILFSWLSHFGEEEFSKQWSAIKRKGRIQLKRLLNLRMKDGPGDFAR